MTILDWLLNSMKRLADAGVDSPRRDCLVLIEDILGKDRSWVISHAEFELSDKQIKELDYQIKRRVAREPLAYIRGKAWFYGRFFAVNPDVLVPRPESESLIDLIKDIKPKNIIDVGTGSGCLAVTAKLELPETAVTAIDIEEAALTTARSNARKYKVDINFLRGNMLEPISDLPLPPDSAILANLPYVRENLATSKELAYEPKTAWLSGKQGLDHYEAFWHQVEKLTSKPEHILTESLEDQHKSLVALARKSGYKLVKTDVLVQQFRLG